MHATADHNQGGEFPRISGTQGPNAVSPHGNASQINPSSVAIELFDGMLQCFERKRLHFRLRPLGISTTLWKHNNERKAFSMGADGSARAYAGLEVAVGAALTGSVQKKNYRKFRALFPARRQIDLVKIPLPAEAKGAFEKSGFMRPSGHGATRRKG